MKIWLDDERPAPEGWHWVKTAQECILCLWAHEDVEELSLDHDLGDDEEKYGTGYDVLLFLEEEADMGITEIIPTRLVIHSANSGARKKMEQAVKSIERMRNA